MAKIASFGAYIPLFRLSRQEMANAWGVPAVPGERSVANADEDSLTMAVAAGSDCLAGIDPSGIDGVFFATTTSPYDEKQCAGVIAAALDMRTDINTADFTGSLRAATTALRAAADAVDSGSAGSILVVAADCRLGEPESMWEQLLGDGAGAVLISKQGPATLRGFTSTAGEQVGVWRRSQDRLHPLLRGQGREPLRISTERGTGGEDRSGQGGRGSRRSGQGSHHRRGPAEPRDRGRQPGRGRRQAAGLPVPVGRQPGGPPGPDDAGRGPGAGQGGRQAAGDQQWRRRRRLSGGARRGLRSRGRPEGADRPSLSRRGCCPTTPRTPASASS